MEMKPMRHKNQSSAAIMLRSLIALVAIITLSLGLLITMAVGHQLLEETAVTSTGIIESIKNRTIDGDDDWENWRKNSTLDTSSSYILVYNKRKDAKIRHYYSPHTKKLLAIVPQPVPIIKNLYYRPGKGLLYHQMVHARGIQYDLWLSMDSQVAVLGRVMEVTLIILLLTLLASPFYIRRLTHRLTDPLRSLSVSTQKIQASDDPGSAPLPVPQRPTEVTDLANNFNALLTELHARHEQQKIFIANAAHELRTPIATIRSHAQLIERHGQDHPEIIPQSVTYITEESRQMQQLITDLMTLSQADQLAPDAHQLDLSHAVETVVAKIQSDIPQKITLQVAPHVMIQGNASALAHIITNLVTNAAKYSPADTVITVALQSDAAHNDILTVTDQGRGISAEDLPHVFERFYRGADVRGSVPGTGLGLAIAAQLAKTINGRFTVTPNQPSGTTIRLIIPPKPERDESPQRPT
ncbi:Signal transduction histidine kinase [Schleiferilactobacillus perolens DSM 12744]|uniref:histidine kinase n=2 Tax=Schleiferilactobacillus perolens TaxID=100468 RepID=A0A0R1MV81_9LACO|nr:Signal transduction histidine kinase [Schleiferilactobacillus perolens DSM 12744]